MNTARTLANPELGPSVYTETAAKGQVSWFTAPRFALLLALLISAFFAGVLFGGQTFFYRDYGGFGYPLAKFHRDCFWRGELPAWNSLSACGLPFLAQWNTMTLYPLSLIYLLAPLPWSLSFFCVTHLFLAGLGMYFLSFHWTKNHFAAAVAGVAFAFNGLTLNCLMYPNNIAALGLMPWVVWQMDRAWGKGGRALIPASLFGAVQMLTGAPEIIAFTWFIIVALAIGGVMTKEISAQAVFCRTALTFGLVLGLTAIQLLPFLDLLAHSERDSKSVVGTGAMPIWGWMNVVLPLFRTIRSTQDVYFQIRQEWTSSYYPGIGVLFLGLIALRGPKHRGVKSLWIVAGLGLVLALGTNGYLYEWIYKLCPWIGFMRLPVKFVVLTLFALPLLAAIALASVTRPDVEGDYERAALKRSALSFWVIMVLVIGAALWCSRGHPYWNLAWRDLFQNGIARIVVLTLVAAALLRLCARCEHKNWIQAALLLTLVLDAWTHMPNQNPTITASAYEPGLVAQQFDPKCLKGEARAMLGKPTWDLLYTTMVADPLKDFAGRRAALFGNCNLLDGVPTPDGFYSMYLYEQRQIWSRLFFADEKDFAAPLADFVGISQLATNIFGWQQRPSACALITAGARPVFLNREQTLKQLGQSSFDSRQVVYLPVEANSSISLTNHSSPRILNKSYQSGRITAEVEAEEPAMLVVAESYYDGWEASVNGKPVKIWRANHAFQAVEIPAGHLQVQFTYREKHLKLGAIISGSTLIGLLGWFSRLRPARRSHATNQRPP